MENTSKKIKWTQVGTTVLILFLTLEVVLLSLQNRDLKEKLSSTSSLPQTETLKPGEKVEAFNAKSLVGDKKLFQYDDPTKNHLLFIFSTTCPFCEKNLTNWESIQKSLANKSYDIAWLSIHNTEKTLDFTTKQQLNADIYTVDTSFSRKYKVVGVPMTILINGKGDIQKVWRGVLKEEDLKEVQSLVGSA